jgi:two-component system, response regulator, stage 0 sporulation protein F
MAFLSPTPANDFKPDARPQPDRLPRILVAEDDDEMRSVVADALRKDGYDVREATHGGQLLDFLSAQIRDPETAVDLIITDIRMPVCNGLKVLETLRKMQWKVPVILMTAFGDDETRTAAEHLGALFFDKPFPIDDLRTTVSSLLPVR